MPKVKPLPIGKKPAPLWKGPSVDGISFSLLAKFLVCRERFRLRVVEGLVEDEGFDHSIEYGSMFHEAEEAHRKGKPWDLAIKRYRTKLLARYSEQSADIHKWAAICMKQFPLYLEYWQQHADETCRQPILAEAAFKVPYLLPSGRMVILRGKFDAVTLLPIESRYAAAVKSVLALKANKNHKSQKAKPKKPSEPELGIFLQENKTKGQIDEEGILGTVAQNLQTMLYQTALRYHCHEAFTSGACFDKKFFAGMPKPVADGWVALSNAMEQHRIAGTLYNVIRRPLADRFAIKQREGRLDKKTGKRVGAESDAQFYQRIADGIKESFTDKSKPQYFMRWKVLLDDEDMERFRVRMFNPILEQLCDWWEWVAVDPFNPWRPRKPSEFDPAAWNQPANSIGERLAKEILDRLDTPDNARITPHYQTPWGVYNSMFGGFRGDYFDYLTADREYRLTQIDTLFPELA